MIFRLLHFLFRLLLLPMVFPIVLLRKRLPKGLWIHITIDGTVLDVPKPRSFFSFGTAALSVTLLSEMIDFVIADRRVQGVLVTIRALESGMATAANVRGELMRLRAAKKNVVVHLPLGGSSKELYVASVAEKIYVGPATTVAPLGFASSSRYVKSALDKLGAQPMVLSRGKYKSAGESLVRDTMSDAQREQVSAVLDAMYEALVTALAEGRSVPRERAQAWIDEAPHSAGAAVQANIVDAAVYEDELPALLGNVDRPATILEAQRYMAVRRMRVLPRIFRKPVIAIISVHGTITGSLSGSASRLSKDERIMSAVRLARMSRRVRAVLLHVDSPGGSALASDRIHHELRQLASEKPLVAFLSNVAASGGYYVAAPAHAIVAQPVTLTGSIGVVGARVAAEPLLTRLGISTETITRGRHAAMLDPLRPLSDSERGALEKEIEATYETFVSVVAQGRGKPHEEIEKVAQGRVWTGSAAHANGLVDVLGGLDVAIAETKRRANLKSADVLVMRAPWSLIPPLLPPRRDALVSSLAALIGIDSEFVALVRSRERVVAWSAIASYFWY